MITKPNYIYLFESQHPVLCKYEDIYIAFSLSYCSNLSFLLDTEEDEEENGDGDTSAGRFVRYQFTPAFLRLRTVGAT